MHQYLGSTGQGHSMTKHPVVLRHATIAWSVHLSVCMYVICDTRAPVKPLEGMRCHLAVVVPSNIVLQGVPGPHTKGKGRFGGQNSLSSQ